MRVKISRILNELRYTFWFIPAMMSLMAIAAGYGMQRVDLYFYGKLDWELTDPEGARAILTTVAGSSITVAGVVFSITMVVLSTASNQFGPRLMRNFMRHRQTKWVLGGYIGTFIYCLMVTATVRGGDYGWTPQLSVTAGGIFGVLSFGLLIAFIHHVSTFLQAPNIINDAATRLTENIQLLFPLSALPKERHDCLKVGGIPAGLGEGVVVESEKEGFLQALNLGPILEEASVRNAVVRIHFKPGDYVLPGEKICTVWCSGEKWEDLGGWMCGQFIIGHQRTDDQDLEFAIDQLVEIAVRALSPGINDPFTAMNCIKKLGGVVSALAEKGMPGGVLHDEDGLLRVATETYTFGGVLDAAFHQIRQNCRGVETVSLTLIDVLARLNDLAGSVVFEEEVYRHANLLKKDVEKSFMNEADLADFLERYSVFDKT